MSEATLRNRVVRVLDDTVVNQIAAGEVVERPASVVKELVENAIDADARNITVVVANGGKSRIEVLDDGCGMSKDDALLAIERFATSKLREASDLESIATLGFRGEALPAIASVSRFALRSARHDDPAGVELIIEGGSLRDVRSKQLPGGTRIEVRDLFYNVPARREFLKAERTELGLIRSLLKDMSAAYPALRIRLVAEGEEVVSLSPSPNFFERLRQLKPAGENALECQTCLETPSGSYEVEAVLSRPVDAVSGAGRLRLLVNGRCVRDRLLLRAIRDGYGFYLKADRYPAGILKLTLPAAELDVNVHPQKAEVRFRRPERVFAVVRRAIERALSAVPVNPSASAPVVFSGMREADEEVQFSSGAARQGVAQLLFEAPAAAANGSKPRLSALRYLGQLLQCYLLLEEQDALMLVDMHAAHERLTFLKLKQQFASGEIISQLLLIPQPVPVPPERAEAIEGRIGFLRRLGFDCELLASDTLLIRAVPAMLINCSAKQAVDDMCAMPESLMCEQLVEAQWDAVLARLACHASVRSGKIMEKEEVYALLQELDEAENAAFCPHGRPVAARLTRTEIETLFGRIA